MKRRVALWLSVLIVSISLWSACGGSAEPTPGPKPSPTPLCNGNLCIIESHLTESGEMDRIRRVEGMIINQGETAFAVIEVSFKLFNEDGEEIGIASADVEDLGPGKRWKFSAQIPGSIETDVSSYEVESLTGS
jgi:hypothetical protein